MSTREYNKDHLEEHASVALEPPILTAPAQRNPLLFWSEHPTENCLVDLRVLADGEQENPTNGNWAGPFTGRPALIQQLAPAVQADTLGMSAYTSQGRVDSFRAWWRVLDAVEASAASAGQPMDRVEDVRQLTELHRQRAYDHRLNPDLFGTFVRAANCTLAELGAPKLHWLAQPRQKAKRHLPPEEQIRALRVAMKQEWEKVLNRWSHADGLRSGSIVAAASEDVVLLKHYRYYENMQLVVGKALLNTTELSNGDSADRFARRTGLRTATMKDGFFPNRWDADAAFHLCLSTTGWNPSTLLAIDATTEFLRTHPKDASRFMVTAQSDDAKEADGGDTADESYEVVSTKARARGREQVAFGLWKNRFGVGPVLKALLARTVPLRDQLKTECAAERGRYNAMLTAGAPSAELTTQYQYVLKLEAGCRSVWLYADHFGGIGWLTMSNTGTYSRVNAKKSDSYLTTLCHELNLKRLERGATPISPIRASDLRDVFALQIWRATGGNIFALMRALEHRRVNTTVIYVDNNILNEENRKVYLRFLNTLFSELGGGRLDLTILAHLNRYGEVTNEMERRLEDYRSLMRSRIRVACKDPFSPPRSIAPTFAADGKRTCPSDRCLMCEEHAVFLPESLDGVAMRVEELLALEKALPVEAWINSRYPVELRNGLAVLRIYDKDLVAASRSRWAHEIAAGTHVVPGLPISIDA